MKIAKFDIPEKGPSSISFWLLLVSLLLLLTYNTQLAALRLVLVSGLMFLPVMYLYGAALSKNFILSLLISIAIMVFLFFCILVNSSTFQLSISGPQGEIFAAIVGFSFIFYLEIIKSKKSREINTTRLLKYFVMGYFGILVFDLLLRYIQEPTCFMNYFCRKEAKTVGLFNTTNVTGVNIATILITLLVVKQAKNFKFLFIFLHLILLTTMARAAIVAYVFVLLVYFVFKSHFFVKLTAFSISVVLIAIIAIYNPYNILSDGSLLSKIDFLNQTLVLAKGADLRELMFGYGASFDSVATVLNVNGWSPHLPFLKAFFYFGIWGIIFYFFSILVPVYVVGTKFIWPLLVNQIAALAGGPMYSPTITCSLVLIYMCQANAKKGKYYEQ